MSVKLKEEGRPPVEHCPPSIPVHTCGSCTGLDGGLAGVFKLIGKVLR